MAERCQHQNFTANVKVNRLEDEKTKAVNQYLADVTIQCTQCRVHFQFLGLKPGLNLQGAAVSIDGLEARLAICPNDERPNPLQKMAYGVEKFDG